MELNKFLESKNIDIALSDKFLELVRLTLDWNEKINVTAITDPEEFLQKSIIDSLTLAGRPEIDSAGTVLDIGTGGGYPGLPLAIAYPEKKFLLMDAVGKKLKVVDSVAETLCLSNVKTIHLRAEDMARDSVYREQFDLVVSRAVANMSTLSEYCLPFVRVGGFFIAYKTGDAADEVKAALKALNILGSESPQFVDDGIVGSNHNFVICRKSGSTPGKYPRKAGIPSKDPL